MPTKLQYPYMGIKIEKHLWLNLPLFSFCAQFYGLDKREKICFGNNKKT